MRILQVHNFYRQAGGEDRVVAAENALLTCYGHEVSSFAVHNDRMNGTPGWQLGLNTIWNQDAYRSIGRLIAERRIELVHVHNTLPQISPAVYYAAWARQTPVVQTLHNYRLLCPAATFYRQGGVCELCLNKTVKYQALLHSCYRDSLGASAAVTTMLAAHHLSGAYRQKIHTFIALTEFARNKFCQGGLPAERISVKPNFLAEDPGTGRGDGQYAVFIGRLTEEKGLHVLLDAWATAAPAMPLKIAGEGPLESLVRTRVAALPNVEYLGHCAHERVIELLKGAAFLVFPSRWYEGMPIVVLEAMACGTPVAAFGLGSLNELIVDGVNGFKLAYPDAGALPAFLNNCAEFRDKAAAIRCTTRAHFETNFSAKSNYERLLAIYHDAVNRPRSLS